MTDIFVENNSTITINIGADVIDLTYEQALTLRDGINKALEESIPKWSFYQANPMPREYVDWAKNLKNAPEASCYTEASDVI